MRNTYEIVREHQTQVKRFNITGRKIEFKLTKSPNNVEPIEWFQQGVQDIVMTIINEADQDDYIGITFCGASFIERGPGWINFKKVGELKFEDVWTMIGKIFQSNSDGLDSDTFCLNATLVRVPSGRGGNKRKYKSFNEECTRKKGIININNNDNLCLPRALVVAKAVVDNDKDSKNIKKGSRIQTKKALELVKNASVIIPTKGAGILEIQKFQEYLSDYRIVVYKYGTKGRDLIFEGTNEGKKLNLLYDNHHYNVIISLTAAFACSYYCETCHKPFQNKTQHFCGGKCYCCLSFPKCTKKGKEVYCCDCGRNFRNSDCLAKHKILNKKNESVCSEIKMCRSCLKTYRGSRTHYCGEMFCNNCNEFQPSEHLCYIQTKPKAKIWNSVLFIFYDLETMQEKEIDGNKKLHQVNLCVFQQRCSQCLEEIDLELCTNCGIRIQILKTNPIERFLEYILNQKTIFKKVIVIAHNGQSFDHQFILNHLISKTRLKPELIMRGSKIILMAIENVKFLDSLNYFPMPLSQLPKAFGLNVTLKKGYFPHLFNKADNANYVGTLPDVKYYSPGTLKNGERDLFIKWYNENKNNVFDFQKELVEYCINDVKILTDACLKFRNMMIKECNVYPFIEATTIASACNVVYRRNFLKPETIGIIPQGGYRYRDNQSKIAIKWLIHQEKVRKIKIIHAAKQKEVIIHGCKVDGFCEETKQIFEFHGCYYHGHPACQKNNRDQILNNDFKSLNLRYEETTAKINRLRGFEYDVIEKWECEFKKELVSNSEFSYLENHYLLTTAALDPRDAFYGGRTGNTKMYYKCKPGEKIKYVDVCSLYPWVCKYGKFPIEHPEVVVGNDECKKLNLDIIDGLIKCKILPPQDLYHPVLPLKQNNKLMFSLCSSCSGEKNTGICNHCDNDRALIGTWVLDEVRKALEKGYKILEIYEIWKYKIDQYDSTTRIGGLFTEMMNKFLKIKQQASGWPSNCSTKELKENYVEQFLNNEGIELNVNEITNNPGLRSLAKLMLNSFWGKFGQRENLPKTIIINETEELFKLLTDPTKIVNNIIPINEETIVVTIESINEAIDSLTTINVTIAAYTTAQARIKLYSYLEAIGERVLYYDTDSVIYVSREDEYDPPIGVFIGEMTNELESYGKDSYITEFVSGGPKNYAYKVFSSNDNCTSTVCKVKGICLNYETSQIVNFEKIKELIMSNNESDITIYSHNFRRTKEHNVITVREPKKYSPKAEKRKFFENFDSVPFGYKRQKIQDQNSIVEIFKKINQPKSKPFLQLHEIKADQMYSIESVREFYTRYGKKWVFELSSNIFFIPNKYQHIFDNIENRTEINTNNYKFSYITNCMKVYKVSK